MLTDEQIDRLMDIRKPYSSAKAIERAVMKRESALRKDDESLIRQMLEALDATHGWWGNGEWYGPKTPHWHELTSVARAAARAHLEKAP